MTERRVAARPDDLFTYQASAADGLAGIGVALAAAIDAVALVRARRLDGLATVPGLVECDEVADLVAALRELDDWLVAVGRHLLEADRLGGSRFAAGVADEAGNTIDDGGALVGWLGAALGRWFQRVLGWASPWPPGAELPVESDLVLVRGGAGLLVHLAGSYGFRIDRYSDGTVEVTELESAEVMAEAGVAATARLTWGSSTLGIDAAAVARVLGEVDEGRTWRVPESDVEALILHRVVDGLGLTGAARLVTQGAASVPDQVGVHVGVLGFGIGGSVSSPLSAMAERLGAASRFDPPAPVRTSVGLGAAVGAEATARAGGVAAAGLSAGLGAHVRAIDYRGGARGVQIRLDAEASARVLPVGVDGSAVLTVERRSGGGGEPVALEVTWTTEAGDTVRAERLVFDYAVPEAAAAGERVWQAVAVDPTAVASALEILTGRIAIAGVTRGERHWSVSDDEYGGEFELTPVLGELGIAAEVTVVSLEGT